MTKSETESIRLVLENGDEIEVTYPTEISEDLFDEMREAQSRDSFWNVGNYTQASAMYKGLCVSKVNMKRVVGIAQFFQKDTRYSLP